MIEVLRVTRGATFYFSQLNEEIDAYYFCYEAKLNYTLSVCLCDLVNMEFIVVIIKLLQ